MGDNSEQYVISLRDVNFMAGMRAAEEQAERTGKKVHGVSSAMDTLKGVVAGFSVAYIGNEIISTLSEFEKFDAVLTNTLGSKGAARAALESLTDFAAKTPFEVNQLTDSFVKLANQGFVPTMDEMRKLGDLASSKGKDIGMLSEALIDAQVGEFERLKEFGVRASKNGDLVSFTFKGQTKTVKATDDAIKDYILSLGDLNGVSGSMAAISGTTGGQISNLKDTITQLYLSIGTKLKPEISAVISGISTLVGWVGQFVNWLTSGSTGANIFAISVAGLAGGLLAYQLMIQSVALWTNIVTAAQWLWNAAMTANPIGIIIVGIGVLIGIIAMLVSKVDGWGQAWDHTWNGVKLIFSATVDWIKLGWMKAENMLMTGIDKIMIAWYKLKGLWDEDGAAEGLAKIQAESDARQKAIKEGERSVEDQLKRGVEEFKAAAGSLSWKKDDDKKSTEKEDFVNGKPTSGATTKGAAAKDKTSNGISEIKAASPKVFNINIDSLIKELSFNTQNLQESRSKIKDVVTETMLTAVNDSQIIAE